MSLQQQKKINSNLAEIYDFYPNTNNFQLSNKIQIHDIYIQKQNKKSQICNPIQ